MQASKQAVSRAFWSRPLENNIFVPWSRKNQQVQAGCNTQRVRPMVCPVFPPRCKTPKILPEHGCFQDQWDATSPGKANTTVMKRLHDWHKSQIIRNICYIFVVNVSVTPQNSVFSCYHFYIYVINVLSVATALKTFVVVLNTVSRRNNVSSLNTHNLQ